MWPNMVTFPPHKATILSHIAYITCNQLLHSATQINVFPATERLSSDKLLLLLFYMITEKRLQLKEEGECMAVEVS